MKIVGTAIIADKEGRILTAKGRKEKIWQGCGNFRAANRKPAKRLNNALSGKFAKSSAYAAVSAIF